MAFNSCMISLLKASSTTSQLHAPIFVQYVEKIIFEVVFTFWIALKSAYRVKMASSLIQTAEEMQVNSISFTGTPEYKSSLSNMGSKCFKLLLKQVWIIKTFVLFV